MEQVTAAIARTSGPLISKKDCARVVDLFLDAIKLALKEQRNIEVRGFGTFKIRRRKTRMARNPRTGEPVEVVARTRRGRDRWNRRGRARGPGESCAELTAAAVYVTRVGSCRPSFAFGTYYP